MTLLMLPRRRRISRLTDHRLARDLRATLPEIPAMRVPDALPDFSDLVDAAIDAGAKQRKALPALRRRPRRRRATTLMLLVAVVGGLVIAYRWWNGRNGNHARLIDAPDSPADAPVEPRPSPWSVPAAEASSSSASPWPMTSPQATDAPPPAEADEVVAEAHTQEPPAERAPITPAHPLPPRATRSGERSDTRLERGIGRGISAARASIPSIRPSIPSRFAPHLPR